ncbi:MAG: hypothetical protein HOA30_16715 [Rhodospirillaceae bacterium]|jgi:carbon monoxide dehydrogenase subunit G|nr:hypothetical protein [Rhodospirillaceae bacterium]MBT6885680.1 hypothetical protein [Rhodospirillaceae bacterium]
MADGFSVSLIIDSPPEEVWTFLTDFANAGEWMPGIDGLRPIDNEKIGLGTRLQFTARNAMRETEITEWNPGKCVALTSSYGGVTATYTYCVEPDDDETRVSLVAVCMATGAWKILRPGLVWAMKRSDSGQLKKLRTAMRHAAQEI